MQSLMASSSSVVEMSARSSIRRLIASTAWHS